MSEPTPTPSFVTQITIAGTVIDLDTVAYALEYNHGRSTVTDGGSASSASGLIWTTTATFPPMGNVGDEITIDVEDRRQFTGRITDARLTHPAADVAALAFTAAGALAAAGGIRIAAATWPAENAWSRAARIFDASGLGYRLQGGTHAQIMGDDIAATDVLSLIGKLADDTGAALMDTPDGDLWLQYLDVRAFGTDPGIWRDAEGNWAAQTLTWADYATPPALALVIPAGAIGFEPEWQTSLGSVINSVAIGYGAAGADYVDTDPESIARYGFRHYGTDTMLADQASAAARGALVLSRQSRPSWALGGVTVYLEVLDYATRAAVAALMVGDRVTLETFPQPSPTTPAFLMVEGWSDSHQSGSGWTRTLALSDPRASFAVLTWQGLAGDPRAWNGISPTAAWESILTPANLNP